VKYNELFKPITVQYLKPAAPSANNLFEGEVILHVKKINEIMAYFQPVVEKILYVQLNKANIFCSHDLT
jgi:hypothetical protein